MNDLSMILFDNKMSMIEEERKHFAEIRMREKMYRKDIFGIEDYKKFIIHSLYKDIFIIDESVEFIKK